MTLRDIYEFAQKFKMDMDAEVIVCDNDGFKTFPKVEIHADHGEKGRIYIMEGQAWYPVLQSYHKEEK